MTKSSRAISQLFSQRNRYGDAISAQKLQLIDELRERNFTSKKDLQSWYNILLFLIAYPDNDRIHRTALDALQRLELYIHSNQKIKDRLFNSGITNSEVCAAFSFEIVKWLRKKHARDIRFSSFEADDGLIQSILSAVMPKVESEILQDANDNWRSWLKKSMRTGEDMLDRLIALFDETDIRPEVKDELWLSLGINVEINFSSHVSLPSSLYTPYHHRSLIGKNQARRAADDKFEKVSLSPLEADQIIECGRMILVRHLREIDPISYTDVAYVSYYRLGRGLSIALTGMVPERRHPIDSYMGYLVFKNGLPVAYAASWVLFDSARIGLNVFPAYRGGESQYIFEKVLKLHSKVYRLRRFTVDPYQLGKENSDGIQSGAFWVYYHAGFRPLRQQQKELARSEWRTLKLTSGYRSPASVLKKLADSRMELILQREAVSFDATDLSLAYARILKDRYDNNRKSAEEANFITLAKLLQEKNYHEEKLQFVLKNWCTLLLNNETELIQNKELRKQLKSLFELKANGLEEDYILRLQQTRALRKLLERTIKKNV